MNKQNVGGGVKNSTCTSMSTFFAVKFYQNTFYGKMKFNSHKKINLAASFYYPCNTEGGRVEKATN